MRVEIDVETRATSPSGVLPTAADPAAPTTVPGGAWLRFLRSSGTTSSFVLDLYKDTDRTAVAEWLAASTRDAETLRLDGTLVGVPPSNGATPPGSPSLPSTGARTAADIRPFLTGRNLVLCSDGTGNAGGKTRGTNVFRIFNDLDWHHAGNGGQGVEQLAFYNDGVGTDDRRLLRTLGGAFGWGLTGNIIELYSFASLNYEPGDRLYLFGFSRGAYTVRKLAGLILTCGLLRRDYYVNSKHSYKLVKRILRAYQSPRAGKLGRDKIVEELNAELHNSVDGSASQSFLDTSVGIKCIGVWDTVDAVGVPLDELRPLLNWISTRVFRRRMYGFDDNVLDPRVKSGVQALAIDDERKTFHPNIWTKRPGVEQVWFAGAHSNVGGGYPKDGLAYVPLDWMMGHAERRGLRFDPGARVAVQEKADAHGKLYDARSGTGIFYRYAPRYLKQLLRAPARGKNPHGGSNLEPDDLRIHTSVYTRVERAPRGMPLSASRNRARPLPRPTVGRSRTRPSAFVESPTTRRQRASIRSSRSAAVSTGSSSRASSISPCSQGWH